MTEDQLQMAAMRWIRLAYPNAVSFHVANERKTSPMRGGKLKKMGVLAGVPDIHILEPNKIYCGLFIELKTEKGRLTPSQKDVIERIENAGYKCAVCRSLSEVICLVDDYFD
tara:strand:+ start:936 stop:1271 length:336 start_codon:yes stop_codon:yes gene_type:complete